MDKLTHLLACLGLSRPRQGRCHARMLACAMAAACAQFACTSEEVTSLSDCYDICDRYRTCFDGGYNTGSCYDRCEIAEGDRYFAQDTEDCRACFFNRSCTSADYNCSPSCDWIVP